MHLAISEVYGGEYARYFMYFLLLVIIPIIIINMIKQRKEDKLNGTNEFQNGILRIGILSIVLIAFYFLTGQDHI